MMSVKKILQTVQLVSIALMFCIIDYSHAQTSLDEIHFTGDIDSSLPASIAQIFSNDDAINVFNVSSQTATNANDLGVLDGTGIDAYHRTGDGCGETIYSVDTAVIVSTTAMLSSDVFTATGTKILDAITVGIPDGINIDAISRDPNTCDLIFSINSASILGGTAYQADDLIRYNNVTGFSLYHTLALNANIDALHILSSNRILVSFDSGLVLPDIATRDEDVYEVGLSASGFQILAFELVVQNETWHAADLNALWALPTAIIDFMFANGFE